MIDKSLRQYYQNGKEVDPYRKGLEIIAGKGKDTIQTTAPGKITARNLIKPAEKMTLPSVRKDKTVPSITTLPKTARPSFDQKKYSGLANAFYDKIKAGEESYLDKYINRDPVRTAGGVEGVEGEPSWEGTNFDELTSSFVGTDKATTSPDNLLAQLVTSPQTDTAITSTGEGTIIPGAVSQTPGRTKIIKIDFFHQELGRMPRVHRIVLVLIQVLSEEFVFLLRILSSLHYHSEL